MQTVIDRMQQIVSSIPAVFRPVLLAFVPFLILHAIFLGTPDEVILEPLTPAPTAPKGAPADAPDPAVVKRLIEGSDRFQGTQILTCPKVIASDYRERQKYPLLDMLIRHEFATTKPRQIMGQRPEIEVELTPAARTELYADLQEDVLSISVAIGEREFSGISGVDNPPQNELEPPLRYATIVSFMWNWKPRNKLGQPDAEFRKLPSGYGQASYQRFGTAYVMRDATGTWSLVDLKVGAGN